MSAFMIWNLKKDSQWYIKYSMEYNTVARKVFPQTRFLDNPGRILFMSGNCLLC